MFRIRTFLISWHWSGLLPGPGAGLGTTMRSAREKAERRIRNAAAQLAELEISPAYIWGLVEARIDLRMRRGQ